MSEVSEALTNGIAHSQHPVDILLDALRVGPADLVALSHRTGFYAGAVLSLVVRARASGFSISAKNINNVTIYELHEETSDDDRRREADNPTEAGEPTPEPSAD